jgi:hypothetical protein
MHLQWANVGYQVKKKAVPLGNAAPDFLNASPTQGSIKASFNCVLAVLEGG